MSFIALLPSFYSFNQPDLGLFLFDIGSDIYNGKTFRDDGNPIWGAVILGAIFIPMTVIYVGRAIQAYRDEASSSQRKKLLIVLFAPILAVPAIPIMTVCYIVYVLYVLTRKFVQPSYDDDDGDNNTKAGNFLLLEAVGEANLQAVLGWFTSCLFILREADFISLSIDL